MRSGLLREIGKTTRQMAFGHPLYNWTLQNWALGGGVPEKFIVIPADPWPGNPECGRKLCGGVFTLHGEQLEFCGDRWEPEGVGAAWLSHLHGFSWLRDLRAVGGETARQMARSLISSWIRLYSAWNPLTWRPEIAGARLAHWIAFYDFFGASADDDFQRDFFAALIRQARHLSRTLPDDAAGLPLLQALRGLSFAGLALKGREAWLEQALNLLEQETAIQILSDGGHVSRSPAQLLESLKIFIDIRSGLLSAKYPVPEQMTHTIDRMAQALRFFRYADKGLAVFNGAHEGDAALIDTALTYADAGGRTLRNLPHTGYERLSAGRTLVMVDTGTPPTSPHDGQAHAAPLAFEMTYGRERVFVSCGTHLLDSSWQNILRSTAAHSTLGVDDRNACEIRADGHFGRRSRKISVSREEKNGAVLIEAAHDGYAALNGIMHRRRLYLAQGGHDLRGEETLTCSVGLSRPVDVCLRFHLHPGVQVSLIQDGREALLRLPGGAGWRFFHVGGLLSLEDSLYLGQCGQPRKTKQLVISGVMECDVAVLKWALQREAR